MMRPSRKRPTNWNLSKPAKTRKVRPRRHERDCAKNKINNNNNNTTDTSRRVDQPEAENDKLRDRLVKGPCARLSERWPHTQHVRHFESPLGGPESIYLNQDDEGHCLFIRTARRVNIWSSSHQRHHLRRPYQGTNIVVASGLLVALMLAGPSLCRASPRQPSPAAPHEAHMAPGTQTGGNRQAASSSAPENYFAYYFPPGKRNSGAATSQQRPTEGPKRSQPLPVVPAGLPNRSPQQVGRSSVLMASSSQWVPITASSSNRPVRTSGTTSPSRRPQMAGHVSAQSALLDFPALPPPIVRGGQGQRTQPTQQQQQQQQQQQKQQSDGHHLAPPRPRPQEQADTGTRLGSVGHNRTVAPPGGGPMRDSESQLPQGSHVNYQMSTHSNSYQPSFRSARGQHMKQQQQQHHHHHHHHHHHWRPPPPPPVMPHRRPRFQHPAGEASAPFENELGGGPLPRPSKLYKRVLLCDKTLVSLEYIRDLELEPRPHPNSIHGELVAPVGYLNEHEINEINENFLDLEGNFDSSPLTRSSSPASNASSEARKRTRALRRQNSTNFSLPARSMAANESTPQAVPDTIVEFVSDGPAAAVASERRAPLIYRDSLLSDDDPLVRCDMWDLEKGLKSRKPPAHILRVAVKADFDTVRDAINRCRQLSERTLPPDDEYRDGLEIMSTEDLVSLFSMKRGLMPGTKWCGLGDQAEAYNDLGPKHRIDICCRAHDHCPIRSKPFRNDYGVLNIGLYTKSHCDCDADFYRCLREVRSRTADMLGNLYFNVMKLQCMREERLKVCREMKPIALGFERCVRYEDSPVKTVFKFTTPPVAY